MNAEKLKICFIAPKAYPLFNPDIKSTFGGAEVQLVLLAKEFATKEGLDIHFMVADYGQQGKERFLDIDVWEALDFKRNIFLRMWHFYAIFKKIDAGIYIQRTLTPFTWIIALYCKLRKKKFIYMCAHDKEAEKKRFFSYLAFHLSFCVIVQSDYQKKQIESLFGISGILIKSSYPVFDSKELIKKSSILWVGRAIRWKRPELFIALAQKNPEHPFVMICPPVKGEESYHQRIRVDAQKIKNIDFIDFVPFDQINPYFTHAKIFINTSEKEGFPNTFIQAAGNSTPIISLNVNPDHFLDIYKCGVVCHNNNDLMNSHLRRILNDQEQYDTMSRNAFDYVDKNHSIRNNAEKLLRTISYF